MNSRYFPPVALLGIALLLAAAFSLAASPRDSGTKRTYDVPAGEAAVALQLFSQQSSLQILYREEEIKGVRTNVLKGEFTAREAVVRLLAGTPLTVGAAMSGAMAIRRADVLRQHGSVSRTGKNAP